MCNSSHLFFAFSGVGYGMVVTSGIVAIYYNVIITYCIFYMFKSITRQLPWVGCGHEWNTVYCSEIHDQCLKNGGITSLDNSCVMVANMTLEERESYNITEDGDLTNYVDPFAASRSRPSEEYYRLVLKKGKRKKKAHFCLQSTVSVVK